MSVYSDQVKIFDPDKWTWPVHIIGAGGANNVLGPLLAKMGVREIHIWDDDTLERRNCPTEVAYSFRMAGFLKIEAMVDAIRYLMDGSGCGGQGTFLATPVDAKCCLHRIGNMLVYAHRERVTENTPLSGVVISGVDSMAARREIWQAVKQNVVDVALYVDGRSGGLETAFYALSPANFEDAQIYESNWLFSDAEASPLECGARNVGFVATYMATKVAWILSRFQAGLPFDFYTIGELY